MSVYPGEQSRGRHAAPDPEDVISVLPDTATAEPEAVDASEGPTAQDIDEAWDILFRAAAASIGEEVMVAHGTYAAALGTGTKYDEESGMRVPVGQTELAGLRPSFAIMPVRKRRVLADPRTWVARAVLGPVMQLPERATYGWTLATMPALAPESQQSDETERAPQSDVDDLMSELVGEDEVATSQERDTDDEDDVEQGPPDELIDRVVITTSRKHPLLLLRGRRRDFAGPGGITTQPEFPRGADKKTRELLEQSAERSGFVTGVTPQVITPEGIKSGEIKLADPIAMGTLATEGLALLLAQVKYSRGAAAGATAPASAPSVAPEHYDEDAMVPLQPGNQ